MSPLGSDRYGHETESDALAAELSDRFRERLRFFAARRLRDHDAAEDVAQEVLRRTLEALREGRVENREALPSFLFQTARYVCMQWSRSEGRKDRAFSRLESQSTEVDPSDDPLAGLISEERREKVREAFEQLGSGEREVLRLSYVEGLDSAEIAAQLHLTAGAVRVRRHRALHRLAEILDVTKRPGREL